MIVVFMNGFQSLVCSRFWQDTGSEPEKWAHNEPWISITGAGHCGGGTLWPWSWDDNHRGAYDTRQLAGPTTFWYAGVSRSPGPCKHVWHWRGTSVDDSHCLTCPRPQLTPMSGAIKFCSRGHLWITAKNYRTASFSGSSEWRSGTTFCSLSKHI